MLYILANKRCKNFGTCVDGKTGQSKVNAELFTQFTKGKNAIHASQCGTAHAVLRDTVIPVMSVPLIQGTLRYAYKIEFNSDEATAKSLGEGYAFMMSVVHRVAVCSGVDAKTIYDAFEIPTAAPTAHALANGKTFADVKKAFENNYSCMGVTCADIGYLHKGVTAGNAVAAACVDAPSAAAAAAAAAAGFLMVLFFGMMCAYKSSKDMTIKMYND